MNGFNGFSLKEKLSNIWNNYRKYIIIISIVVLVMLIVLIIVLSNKNNKQGYDYELVESVMVYSAKKYIENNEITKDMYISLNYLNIEIDSNLKCNSNSGVLVEDNSYTPYLMCEGYNSQVVANVIKENEENSKYGVLLGDNPYIVTDTYQELGISLVEGYTVNIKDSNIDNGINKVTYNILESGSYVTHIDRIVIAEGILGSAPVIELVGNQTRTLEINTQYIESGYTATDKIDGNITDKVNVDGSVDTSRAGTYTLTYTVTNTRGKSASVKRKVIVNDNSINLTITNTITPSSTTYDEVKITLDIKGEGYSYTITDNGEKVTSKNPTYTAYKNGTYEFTVYDKNNNSEVHEVSISNIKDREPEITDIQVNGILVTLTAKKGENNIAGYYFSKTNTAPTGNENNWVNTSSDTFEVVKIPGTYYAYVKDSKGIISLSNEKIVTIQNEAIYWGNSTIISTSLSSNLEKKGYSIIEFNKLIARSARSAGLYTKDAVATVAATLIITLKNYNIRVPYYWGGKYQNFGANPNWGAETNSIHTGPSGKTYNHLGLDCSGFVVWSYRNAGFNMKVTGSQYFASHYYSTETGGFGSDREIGDLIVSSGHIALIIGKYDKGYIVAENANNIYLHPFTKKNGYRIQNTDITINNSSLYFKDSDYPSGY